MSLCKKEVNIITPKIGEPIDVTSGTSYQLWWRGLN